MKTEVRVKADNAKRLKHDTTFGEFVQDVRDAQIRAFTHSAAADVDAREEAHAILRALNKIEMTLDAAIAAEVMLDRKK